MKFSLSTPEYRFECELSSKINIVSGLSGQGKTELYNGLFSEKYNKVRKIKLSDGVRLYRTDEFMSDKITPENNGLWLVVLDEGVMLNRNNGVVDKIRTAKNFYFIIMSREQTRKLLCATYGVFRMNANGINHNLVPLFDDVTSLSDNNKIVIDTVLCEDSTVGLAWFKSLYPNLRVITSKGKDSFTRVFKKECVDSQGVLCIFDTAAFGNLFAELINTSVFMSGSVGYIREFRCFEYMLLSSNLYKYLGDSRYFKDGENLKYYSDEEAYEVRLGEVSSGNRGLYLNHNRPPKNIPMCYVKNCCYAEDILRERIGKCMSRLINKTGENYDKFYLMLVDTEFEQLLSYRKEDAE